MISLKKKKLSEFPIKIKIPSIPLRGQSESSGDRSVTNDYYDSVRLKAASSNLSQSQGGVAWEGENIRENKIRKSGKWNRASLQRAWRKWGEWWGRSVDFPWHILLRLTCLTLLLAILFKSFQYSNLGLTQIGKLSWASSSSGLFKYREVLHNVLSR